MEIDISGSDLNYQTGDHIAVWPINSGKEVDRFLDITGLLEKRDRVISLKALEPTAKIPFPTPTTYDAIVRYHMEISSPVSRQFIATLAPFAPTETAKAEMTKLGSDKNYFRKKITNHYFNIAQALAAVSESEKWTHIPFSIFVESLRNVQPRYYSISSTPLLQSKKISITVVVESLQISGRAEALKGVTTNYLLSLMKEQHGDPNPDPHSLCYDITGPRNKYKGIVFPSISEIRISSFHRTFPSPLLWLVPELESPLSALSYKKERHRRKRERMLAGHYSSLGVGKTLKTSYTHLNGQ
jgi:NADPH-ferrihemoprotein reductase